MEYEVKEYLDMIMGTLKDHKFFETCPFDPNLMKSELLKRMEHNLDTQANYRLTDQDILEVFDRCISIHVDESIQEALDAGVLEITGVDPNGELIYGLADQKETQTVTAKFERLGPFGTYCLN